MKTASAGFGDHIGLAGVPVVCDLDGTLIRTNSLHEGLSSVLFHKPLALVRALQALVKVGKVEFKKIVDQNARDGYLLTFPENAEVVEYLQKQKLAGRKIHLYTGAHQSVAEKVAARFGSLFETVVGSEGHLNNVGGNKVLAIQSSFTFYEYLGDSDQDYLPLKRASIAKLVTSKSKITRKLREIQHLELLPVKKAPFLKTVLKQMRVHQYVKNLLLFVSILASHQFHEPNLLFKSALAFVAFSLGASAIYIVNDLVDLPNDRVHDYKRKRPIASGNLSLRDGGLVAACCLALSLWLATFISLVFLAVTLVYLTISVIYSFALKRIAPLDVFILAGLYTLRVVAGAIVIGQNISFWLLSFSIFSFLSLALLKRYAELSDTKQSAVGGRGYRTTDISLVVAAGMSSAIASVIVLALYADSAEVERLYQNAGLVWLLVPVILYWLLMLWFKAGHQEMHSDPIIFALKNKQSLFILIACAMIFVAASSGFPNSASLFSSF